MRKKKIVLIIMISIICLSVLICGYFWLNKKNITKNNKDTNNTIYSTTYYFGFGSRKVTIYENGDVYDDLEIEEPNHKPNYKFVKTLSEEQLNSLIEKLEITSNRTELDNFVIELVYGVKKFDNFGNYFNI